MVFYVIDLHFFMHKRTLLYQLCEVLVYLSRYKPIITNRE